MAASVAPEFARFVAAQQPEARAAKPRAEGQVGKSLLIAPRDAARLLPVAARRAAGFFRPTLRTEVVWVEGESELAVGLDGIKAAFGAGFTAGTARWTHRGAKSTGRPRAARCPRAPSRLESASRLFASVGTA